MRRLMCPPDYFDIEYEINPWMDRRNRVDPALARIQWDRLVETLRGLGDTLDFIAPDPRCPDMTFSGDGGIVVDNFFIPSTFRVEERKLEVAHYVEWFGARGFTVVDYGDDIYFEGLGDVVFHGKRAVLGHGVRSESRSFEVLRQFVPDLEILCKMEIVDDRFFHLAMALAFVGDHTVLYYPPAFTPASVEALKMAVADPVAVSDEDACGYFACNNLVIGNRVLLDGATPRLAADLAERGLEPLITPMSEFKKSGGSLRCLVLSFVETNAGAGQ